MVEGLVGIIHKLRPIIDEICLHCGLESFPDYQVMRDNTNVSRLPALQRTALC